MSGPREPVPFAFIADADRFRSNVTPPPPQRASAGQLTSRLLLGLTIVAALVGSLMVGMPALSLDHSSTSPQHSQASQGH
ncbi:hypothetical protein [Streptomyces sp. NPDC049915]|uniref:hypothetical protein n=1 Tax=Streptomyces sp. NPDC049915 TaxID=3155510 RepID=UPI00341EC48F